MKSIYFNRQKRIDGDRFEVLVRCSNTKKIKFNFFDRKTTFTQSLCSLKHIAERFTNVGYHGTPIKFRHQSKILNFK